MRVSTLLILAAAIFTVEAAPTWEDDHKHEWDPKPLEIAFPNHEPKFYNSSLEMSIDPNSIWPQTRAAWCTAHSITCEELCDDQTIFNTCDYYDVSYDCRCASNNSAPGLQYYAGTVPSAICRALYEQCTREAETDDHVMLCEKSFMQHCGRLVPEWIPDDRKFRPGEKPGSGWEEPC